MRPVQRIESKLPVQAMQTYRISKPVATHTRPATCAEVDCPDFVNGWMALLDPVDPRVPLFRRAVLRPTDLGDGIRRSCTVRLDVGEGLIGFVFAPGTPCKRAHEHRRSLERPEVYLVRGGDWRANLGLIRRHNRPEHWVEDMQGTLAIVERRANG